MVQSWSKGNEMRTSSDEVADYVSGCIQLAMLLEVSAYPKPGNVDRTHDFEDTRYEDFLASAVAVASPLREAARKGCLVSVGSLSAAEVKIGSIIKRAVQRMNTWQSGGNTSLGTLLLLCPIAVAAGMIMPLERVRAATLRTKLRSVVKNTTPFDAVEVYKAISLAKPSGLGEVERFDITNKRSRRAIVKEKKTLLDIFRLSSAWDSVAYEWANGYPITFELGYPYFTHELKTTGDIRVATVHTFLRILSQVPDTLIARKVGVARSREVSLRSMRALDAGGLLSKRGRRMIFALDRSLRTPNHRLNPGTTADLTASTLAVAMLEGHRP